MWLRINNYAYPLPVLTEIFCATIFPPITANAVHMACPRVPPRITPSGFWEEGRKGEGGCKTVKPSCILWPFQQLSWLHQPFNKLGYISEWGCGWSDYTGSTRYNIDTSREKERLLTSLAPSMMVVSCDLSPHSARKVREKACKKMGETKGPSNLNLLLNGILESPCSKSEPEPWVN